MKILNRHIAATYFKILGLCVSSFLTIYLIIDFLEKINRFSRAHAKLQYIALYFLCKIPEIISQVMPLAALMSTLLALGALSRHNEIIAMRGCGISLSKITAPILGIAFLLSILTFLSNELIVTETSQEMKYIDDVLIEGRNPNAFFRQNNIWYREKDLIIQAKLFEPDKKALEGVTLWRIKKDMDPVNRIEADRCVWNGNTWMLENVVNRSIAEGSIAQSRNEATMPIALDLRLNDLKVLDKHADTIGFFKLKRYCENLKRSGYDPTRFLALMHSKISLPFACLVMAFLGIPFVIKSGRSSGMALGIGLSLIIGFIYYVINAVLFSFGQAGVLPPLVSAWAANFVFALSAIWLTMTVNH